MIEIQFAVHPLLLILLVGVLLVMFSVSFMLGTSHGSRQEIEGIEGLYTILCFFGVLAIAVSLIGGFLVGVGLVK